MNAKIRTVFGDNNIRRKYIQYLLNPNKSIPIFPPVLYREVNQVIGCDEYDINALSKHKALIKKVMREFHQQYQQYL
jgi:hypothetical protein